MIPNSLIFANYSVGHTSSVHNSWAFTSTRTFKEHNTIFSLREWMWADSAYPSETLCVAPYKKPIGGKLTLDQKTYNYHVSKVWLPLGIHETSPY